ncbi:MAG: NUDIX hydrolase [Deltaproteobacteria bacterium]|nr:NUDIX hydrolase [Deltaproteobacteria bacterium]MCF8120613.1 NUDIX hydrolase [Deltaproteobacteria bacterium]
MPPKPWDVVFSERDRSYRVFSLRTDRARSPRTRKIHRFFILESSSWVNVIPVTPQGEVVLVRQYRHGTREVTLEIPGGLVEANDTPESAAARELLEETGYGSKALTLLGYVHPNPAIQNNRCYTYVARDSFPAGGQQLDDREDIQVILEPVHRIPALIQEGIITHALVLAAFYRFFMEYQPLSTEGTP